MKQTLDSISLTQHLTHLNRNSDLPWSIEDDHLHKSFVFQDFARAFGFMSTIAIFAEHMDHHPDWCNSYNKVIIDLTTHQSGGITEQDFSLAQKIEDLFRQLS